MSDDDIDIKKKINQLYEKLQKADSGEISNEEKEEELKLTDEDIAALKERKENHTPISPVNYISPPIIPVSPSRSPPRKKNRIIETPEKSTESTPEEQEKEEYDQDGPEVRWGDVEEPTWAFMEEDTLWKKINIIKIAGKKSLGLVLNNMKSNLQELYVKDFKKEVDPAVKLKVPQGSIMLEIKYYKHTPENRNEFIGKGVLYDDTSFKCMSTAMFQQIFNGMVETKGATHVRILFATPDYLRHQLIKSKTIDLTFKFRF